MRKALYAALGLLLSVSLMACGGVDTDDSSGSRTDQLSLDGETPTPTSGPFVDYCDTPDTREYRDYQNKLLGANPSATWSVVDGNPHGTLRITNGANIPMVQPDCNGDGKPDPVPKGVTCGREEQF